VETKERVLSMKIKLHCACILAYVAWSWYIRLVNPTFTETQLFIAFWPYYLLGFAFVALNIIAIYSLLDEENE